MTDHLLQALPKVRGTYRENANLAKTNWFNVGGDAQILYRPADTDDLCHFLQNKPADIPITILGVGSNLLVRDGGIEGVTIKLGRNFTGIKCSGNRVIAGAGALSFNVAMFSSQHSLTGLEFLSGIPGTIGGAVFMNAGAYGSDSSSVLEYAMAVDEKGTLHKLSLNDIGYVYRGNTLPNDMIFVEAVFNCQKGDKAAIIAKIDQITQTRQSTQPVKSRTSGSTFKNPEGEKKAWQLIDESGCRGLTQGGAQVSEKHCNFFINTGNATASDIEQLGEEVRKLVEASSGIKLQWEIQIIGKK